MCSQNLKAPGGAANAPAHWRIARVASVAMLAVMLVACGGAADSGSVNEQAPGRAVALGQRHHSDESLGEVLRDAGFTGTIESKLGAKPFLGRKVDARLAELGRLLFFDTAIALHDDNACAGCHSPAQGFGDTQSIAIGVDNNGVVGPNRAGPRNQRRSPLVVNTPFYPKLMWNGRFSAPSGNPFDNSQGFDFPPPEGRATSPSGKFGPNDPKIEYLLVAQAHIPSTELVEMAGFTGVTDLGVQFLPFNNGRGSPVPAAVDGFRNEPIRRAVLARLNATSEYRKQFGKLFPEVDAGGPIDFSMIGRAIAEFEFTLVRANAPIDRYARGERNAMNESEQRGALLFFGKAHCVACHAVAGPSNEMFSDFQMHNIGVPQLAPEFGVGRGNVVFDGPGENEDFGLAQLSGGAPDDRYKFRSSPLRNVALQAAFFHNGAFTRLEDAIRHHLDVKKSAREYDPRRAGVDRDLRQRMGPIEPVLEKLDPMIAPIELNGEEFEDLVAFVRNGLLDPKARPGNLCREIPKAVPSGRPLLTFEGCGKERD
jgi:cytochrome c peroxidase